MMIIIELMCFLGLQLMIIVSGLRLCPRYFGIIGGLSVLFWITGTELNFRASVSWTRGCILLHILWYYWFLVADAPFQSNNTLLHQFGFKVDAFFASVDTIYVTATWRRSQKTHPIHENRARQLLLRWFVRYTTDDDIKLKTEKSVFGIFWLA